MQGYAAGWAWGRFALEILRRWPDRLSRLAHWAQSAGRPPQAAAGPEMLDRQGQVGRLADAYARKSEDPLWAWPPGPRTRRGPGLLEIAAGLWPHADTLGTREVYALSGRRPPAPAAGSDTDQGQACG